LSHTLKRQPVGSKVSGWIHRFRPRIVGHRTELERFRKKPAPFKNYFFFEYDDDLRQSSWSDDEDVMQDRRSRFTSFRLRDSEADEERTKVQGAVHWGRELN
jgi:hypothetical protein